MASIALNRDSGVYSSNFETRSTASGGVRGRNTCASCQLAFRGPLESQTLEKGWGLI